MADNVTLNSGSGGDSVAADDISGVKHQRVKVQYGADGSATDVSDSNPLPIDDAGGSLTVDNGGLTELAGAINSSKVDINISSGSIPAGSATIGVVDLGSTDNAVLDAIDSNTDYGATTGGGAESGALRVTIANDSTGVLSVDDGGSTISIDDGSGSITIDGTVTSNLSATDNPVLDDIASKAGSIKTAVEILDNAISGSEMQVDVLSIAAGDNNIGNVDIASALPAGSNTIGVVDLGSTDNAVLDDIASKAGSIKTAVEVIDNAISGSDMQVDVVASLPAGTNNIGDVDIASALPAGSNAIGKLAANSGVDIGDVDVTSISAGSNLVADVGLSGARTSGGTTAYKNLDVDESEDQVKASGGQVFWILAFNIGTAVRYLKFYNAAAASVTVGSTTPVLTLPLPTQAATANGAGFSLSVPNGIAFSSGITIACTTGAADDNTGAPGTGEVIVNLGYA